MMDPLLDVKPEDRPKVVISPLNYDCDIDEALHKDGSWYLVPEKFSYHISTPDVESIVFHVCSKSWKIKVNSHADGPTELFTSPYTSHWYTPSDILRECPHCHESVPDTIKTLFLLHNWNSLSGKG